MARISDASVDTLIVANTSLLTDWLLRLPQPSYSAHAWLRQVLDGDLDVQRAIGLTGSDGDSTAIRAVIDSTEPAFRGWRSNLNQRLQIYLGGVEGLARSDGVSTELQANRWKIRALREMFGHEPHSWPRTPRTLAAVAAAVDARALRSFMTSEADSELWVVLKTLQENMGTHAAEDALESLIGWLIDRVSAETRYPGQHIADRRHAWWAVRTLYQAVDEGYLLAEEEVLVTFLHQLLSEPIYVANSIAAGSSLVHEFHSQIVAGWELINISELLRGWDRHLDRTALRALQQRENALMGDLLADDPPVDMRVATIYARAGLTYLANDCPQLWGKDVH